MKIKQAVRQHPNIPFWRHPNKNNIWKLKCLKGNERELTRLLEQEESKFNRSWLNSCRKERRAIIKSYCRNTIKLIKRQ